MRWIGVVPAVALAAAAFGSESRPRSARGICTKALKAVDEFPDDVEENVRILTNAMARVPDKRYRRILAHRLSRFQRAVQQEKNLEAEEIYEEALTLLEERPEDYVGNAEKLERYLAGVAGTKYEDEIKEALEAQKKLAEKAGGERDPKYKLMDVVKHVRDHPEKHYLNAKMLEEALGEYSHLPQVIEELEIKGLLELERAGWKRQEAEWRDELKMAEELVKKIQPDDYDANSRLLNSMKKKMAGTPLEKEVDKLLASVRGAPVADVPSAAGDLSGEEKLVRLAADVMSSGASTSEVMVAERLAEDSARTAAEAKPRMAELEKALRDASTVRELRAVAAELAALPSGRPKAVEVYENAAADKDPKEAALAWRGLGDLLARLPLEEFPAELAARKGRPDSWRYALACYEKAAKGDPEMAGKDDFQLAVARLCVELAAHFKEKGNAELVAEHAGLARDDLGPLANSPDEGTKNAASKLLGLLEGLK